MGEFLFLKIDKKYFRLKFSEILFIQAEKKQVRIVTAQKDWICSVSISQVERFLPVEMFCKIHRSYIVSIGQIDYFENEAAYCSGRKVPIAEQYRALFKKSINIVDCTNKSLFLDNGDVDKLLRDINSK